MEGFGFYKKLRLLSKTSHRELRIVSIARDYRFASDTNIAMLVGAEFSEAYRHFPIVFVPSGAQIIPAALLGLRDSENLFVDRDGRWLAGYVPFFFQRYPFLIGEGSGTGGAGRVFIDEAFPGFTTKDYGDRLFDDEGNPSAFLSQTLTGLDEFFGCMDLTEAFTRLLRELDLLVDLAANVELPDGRRVTMSGMFVVDENKLLDLDPHNALKLIRSRGMAWVYAHLISLGNLDRLTTLLAERDA
ncbi:MAG: SapC family protein [Magnetococcales bacterium]|nr:SapC family protein [Magnetococcales bacterium]